MVLTWPDKKDGCFKLNFMQEIIEMEAESGENKESDAKQDKIQSHDPRERFDFYLTGCFIICVTIKLCMLFKGYIKLKDIFFLILSQKTYVVYVA